MDFAVPADHRVKRNESEKRDKVRRPCLRPEKTTEHESGDDTNCNWHVQHGHQRFGTGTEGLGKKRTSGDH